MRAKQISNGKIEIPAQNSLIDSLKEFLVHNPVDYSKEYIEPLDKNDVQTYISPLLYIANSIWFKHSNNYGLSSLAYIPQDVDYLNINEIIKNSELIDSEIDLNESGTLTFNQIVELCTDDNKKELNKLLINLLKDNKVKLITKELNVKDSEEILSP